MVDPVTVDASGTFCPMPILKLARAALALEEGTELVLVATDPAVREDLRAWCRATGHTLLSQDEEGSTYRGRVRLCQSGGAVAAKKGER